ncbi:MAG: ThuA domain-containing protein [Chloroflexi bacterium]|nr:ThuA domain-containing protein [Chloroflexota bacterium]
MSQIRVTVWNEFWHEQHNEQIRGVYPDGIHSAIGEGLKVHGFDQVGYATLPEPEHGLTEEVLANTDVLLWWGHMAHDKVSDDVVARVHARVLDGMGLIVLHSGHYAKIFKKLMGTSCDLKWREINERERVWCVNPAHPIADGLPDYFEIPHHEMYGEPFGIPEPDSLVFVSWFQGGEVFRGGCCFSRGRGKIFYFSPGHETFPVYYQAEVRQVLANAVRWAAPTKGPRIFVENRKEPLEAIG